MNYLINYLNGEPEASIKGLKLCHDNYEVIRDFLSGLAISRLSFHFI